MVFAMFKCLLLLIVAVTTSYGASIAPKGLVPRLDGRIIGGYPTTIESHPHQVSLRYFGGHRCGGSIIKSHIAVTAAHCTDGIAAANFQIIAGITQVTKDTGVTRSLKQLIQHEEFDSRQFLNDVSLLFLEKELEFTQKIQPIALARSGEKLKAGTMVRVTGWGTLEVGGPAPEELQEVYVSVVSNEDCAKAYEEINPVHESMMCAGEPYGGKDACQGDSGGPLITNGKLYGIVSWGVGCAYADFPGAYADVGNLREWMDFKITISPF